VYRTLRAVRDEGTAMLVVEQHVSHALELADDVAVLSHGEVAFAGPAGELGDIGDWLLPAARLD
jgi:branched-chain amino acid transport system ATP-binding protein